MALTQMQRFAYKLFRKFAEESAKKNHALEVALEQAHMRVRPEVYIASCWLYTIFGGIIGVAIAIILNLIILPGLATLPVPIILPPFINYVIWATPLFIALGTYAVTIGSPASKAKARVKSIDRNLPYAVNYMAAMASADVNPTVIFRGLSEQKIYGEIQAEAALIARDVEVFGKDLMAVLHKAIARSPSVKFQDFIQGIITTTASGGDLKVYLMAKSDQYMKENRVEQRAALETLGLMAESFVTVVVAMPLFLLVMMSVMAMMGDENGMAFLYIIVCLMIPLMQVMFIFILKSLAQTTG
jgi:flagellar protein FlaJ